MNIIAFDLYGNEKKNNHSMITFSDMFFDKQNNLEYQEHIPYTLSKKDLEENINQTKYWICHNFFWYDGEKLSLIQNRYEKIIDTLLIDCLFSFSDSLHHNLEKTDKNTPAEDAKNTFKIFEKNIKIFHHYDIKIKNILYSLLVDKDEYKAFFLYYNELTQKSLSFLSKKEILVVFSEIWKEKHKYNFQIWEILSKHLHKNLAFAYFVLFFISQKIIIPEFILKNNPDLLDDLRSFLWDIHHILWIKLCENIEDYLQEFSWFRSFQWNQKKAVELSMYNENILLTLPTWGWKSLIYQLPAWILWTQLWELTIIITPLKALIKDQIDGLNDKWFNEVDFLNGDQNTIEKEIIYEKIKTGKTKMLFLTPEMLRNEHTLQLLNNRFIRRFVIDEAHTLVLWGGEFRPDYFFIKTFLQDLEKINLNKNIWVTLLTATAPVDLENELEIYFDFKKLKIIKSPDILKSNILWQVINTEGKEKKDVLLHILSQIKERNIPTLVFVKKKKWENWAEEIVKFLHQNGFDAHYFHADLLLNQKKKIQQAFINGEIKLIIATKAFWMGIDKKDIRLVIHYDIPDNIEDYMQEIGRAGRDNKKSKNIIFYNSTDIKEQQKLLQKNNLRYYHVTNFLKNLQTQKDIVTLSPRKIAEMSGIQTKKWYTVNVKVMLNFLERENILWFKLLKRKYDNAYIKFNNIKKELLNSCYEQLEKTSLTNEEQNFAKVLLKKIIWDKESIDLNNLEENFTFELWENFNFKKSNVNKILSVIQKLDILDKVEDKEILVFSASTTYKQKNYRKQMYQIYRCRVEKIDTFMEQNNSDFLEKVQSYYLFHNYIKKKNGKIKVKKKEPLIKHFDDFWEYWQEIIQIIFKDEIYDEKYIVTLDNLIKTFRKKYKYFHISKFKKVLFFLNKLDILRYNWVLVFLNNFTIEINSWAKETLKNLQSLLIDKNFREQIDQDIKRKFDFYKKVKILKFQALTKAIQVLEQRWIWEYGALIEYYFRHSIQEFDQKYILSKNYR